MDKMDNNIILKLMEIEFGERKGQRERKILIFFFLLMF
jgi:hypothetical protein